MDDLEESVLEEPIEPATEQATPPDTDEAASEAPTEPEPEPELEPELEAEIAGDAAVAEPESGEPTEVAQAVESEAAPEAALKSEDVLGQFTEPSPRVPWWPYLTYGVLWIGLVAYAATQISVAETAVPAVEQAAYPYVVLAGLVLTLLGPLASIIVWVVVWVRAGVGKRGGLFTSAFVRGAVSTLLGVAAWWGALYVLDALRLGIIGPLG